MVGAKMRYTHTHTHISWEQNEILWAEKRVIITYTNDCTFSPQPMIHR